VEKGNCIVCHKPTLGESLKVHLTNNKTSKSVDITVPVCSTCTTKQAKYGLAGLATGLALVIFGLVASHLSDPDF
jgi:hypothetical protein